MQDSPSAALLVAEVSRALEAGLEKGFPQKVAANALNIAVRELETGGKYAAAERRRLERLVEREGSLADLNADLAAAIADGRMGRHTPGLLAHLIRTTVEKLEVDQPGYPAYRACKVAR